MKIDPGTISSDAAYYWLIATIVPRPIAWVSTINENGTANLAPFSFFTGVCGDPPMLAISVSSRDIEGATVPKDTWRNVARTGEMVVSLVPEEHATAMNVTAAEAPYGMDEFDLAGLTKLPSERVSPPRVAESPVSMECRLDQIVEVGRTPNALIVAEVVLWHVRDELVVDGHLDPQRLHTIARLGASWYTRTHDLFEMKRPRPR